MTKFSFPPLSAGPPSCRNWYQELLDDPGCHGNPVWEDTKVVKWITDDLQTRVQEAYETHRDTWRAKQFQLFSTTDTNPVTPDQALIKHLARQKKLSSGQNPVDKDDTDVQEINCCVIWARPPTVVLDAIQKIQNHLLELVGNGLYPIPRADLHLSVIELSHRHTVPQLRNVLDQIGSSRIQDILDQVSTLSTKPELVSPTVSFDRMGIALNYLPSDGNPYTYHHLRSDMHAMALESGVKIDMCYTAPSAHITIGRFIDNQFFETAEARAKFVDLVKEFNKVQVREQDGWVVGENEGLEVQLGYLKFGRESSKADLVGKV
jgi:hypothetical protein